MKCYLFCSHLASRSLQDVQLSKHLYMKSLPPPRGTCWRAHYLERKKPNTRWRLSSSAVPQPLPVLITSCHGRVIFSCKCLSDLVCNAQLLTSSWSQNEFVCRFGWAVSLSLTETLYVHGDLLTSVLSPLEVFRRFIWNFFRLENEHLNNCGEFWLQTFWECSTQPLGAGGPP